MIDEQILVVKKEFISNKNWTGFEPSDFSSYLEVLKNHREFLPRSEMEKDSSYKQIIPYLIFEYDGKYFVMQRKAEASEQRLKSKFSIGIGGHIREDDIKSLDLSQWANREFHEEVLYDGKLEIKPLGVVNDDSNSVGEVHIGFVFLLKGFSGDIKIRSEHKSGRLMSLKECLDHQSRMETWSSMVLDYLGSL